MSMIGRAMPISAPTLVLLFTFSNYFFERDGVWIVEENLKTQSPHVGVFGARRIPKKSQTFDNKFGAQRYCKRRIETLLKMGWKISESVSYPSVDMEFRPRGPFSHHDLIEFSKGPLAGWFEDDEMFGELQRLLGFEVVQCE